MWTAVEALVYLNFNVMLSSAEGECACNLGRAKSTKCSMRLLVMGC
jgi:hypothetical protein